MPAAASYLRRPGESEFSAYKLDVLRVEADRIAEITTFGVSELVRLGVPPVLRRDPGTEPLKGSVPSGHGAKG